MGEKIPEKTSLRAQTMDISTHSNQHQHAIPSIEYLFRTKTENPPEIYTQRIKNTDRNVSKPNPNTKNQLESNTRSLFN